MTDWPPTEPDETPAQPAPDTASAPPEPAPPSWPDPAPLTPPTTSWAEYSATSTAEPNPPGAEAATEPAPEHWPDVAEMQPEPIVAHDQPVHEPPAQPEPIVAPESLWPDQEAEEGPEQEPESVLPEGGDETVFELVQLSSEQRRHLGMRLTGASIRFRWEVGTDLVVATRDADLIDSFLDEVENPEGFGADELQAFEDLEDVDDEAVYSAMSNLYVAADKLMQRADDTATAGVFYLAADGVVDLPAPFGFDPRVWDQVKSLSESIVKALDAEADPDAVEADARTLRQLLVNFV